MPDTPRVEVSRRGFLKGAGLTAATTVLDTASALARDAQDAVKSSSAVGPDAQPIKLHVNGQEHAVTVEPRYTLAETLRDQLDLTGTKVGLRSRLLFRVHRVGRRHAATRVHDPRHRCGRPQDHHNRRPLARRAAAPCPGRVCQARRHAMRLLHARHGDELRGASGAQSQSDSRPT